MPELSLLRDRARLSLGLMVALVSLVLATALVAPWHSTVGVDARSYLEMIQGVTRHAMPYTLNGPAAEFPELRARWNVLHEGRLWGAYQPVFAYLAVPAFWLDGVRGVIRLNLALLLAVALAARSITRSLGGGPLLATSAAYATICATAVGATALDVLPYSFAIATSAWCVAGALRALDAVGTRARVIAGVSGVLGGLAVGSIALPFPIVAVVVLALGVLPGDGPPSAAGERAWVVWLRARERGAWAALGMAVPLAWVSAMNHLRFGTWSPLGAGLCPWLSCATTGVANQAPAVMLAFAAPVLAWAALSLAALFFVRASRVAFAFVAAAALLALVPPSVLHDRALALGTMAVGFLFDTSRIDMSPLWRPADGLGNMLGNAVVKSTLQSAPALALAFLADFRSPQGRRALWLVALPCVALYLSLVLRATVPAAYALGYPLLNLRYMAPALPLAVPLAVCAVRPLPWRAWHGALFALATAALWIALAQWTDDVPHARRWLLLRGTLVVAALAFVLVARARAHAGRYTAHVAVVTATLAWAVGTAVSFGVDARTLVRLRNANDHVVDLVAFHTPQKFALVGWPQIDTALALKASRDIEYFDLYESTNWANFRTMISRWTAEGRPIFALWPLDATVTSPWPEVSFEPVEPEIHLVRVVLH